MHLNLNLTLCNSPISLGILLVYLLPHSQTFIPPTISFLPLPNKSTLPIYLLVSTYKNKIKKEEFTTFPSKKKKKTESLDRQVNDPEFKFPMCHMPSASQLPSSPEFLVMHPISGFNTAKCSVSTTQRPLPLKHKVRKYEL